MTAAMTRNLRGYATDIPYLRDFKPMLAPAWLDHVALVAGVAPPARQNGFAWCDLGCGHGVTAVILAATHPAGIFHGIDALPAHIDHARRLGAEAATPNARFHCLDFAAAAGLDLPQFDYIVAHGVYTWVDRETQCALRAFIDGRLKPGGLVYISYNAMPGWTRDLPFQRLVRELGQTFPGDTAQCFSAAAEIARALAELRVPALAASYTLDELKNRPQDYAPAYLVHEFMPAAWQPLYVTEVRGAMSAIGLEPVGSATLSENFDCMVLSEAARAVLATIADANAREMIRDFCLDQRFRCDVFARGNPSLHPDERTDRLLSSTFALARPVCSIRYTMPTPAGPLSYDQPVTRMIIEALAAGPRTFSEANNATEVSGALMTLCATGDIIPVEPGSADIGNLNRLLSSRVGRPDEIHWLALPCGTALEVDRELMALVRDGEKIDDMKFPGWRQLLAAHAACP
jgi:SAM-dependent methyltransferase